MKQTFSLLALATLLLFLGCTSSDGPGTVSLGGDSQTKADSNALDGLPSPVQMALLLMNADAPYNNELLNPQAKADAYGTPYKQALNLGVYQADLAYAISHDQTQTALDYFKVVKQLGDKLGILSAFDQSMISRAEKNLGNRDSLFDISSTAFADAEAYLEDSKRREVADLIAVGGWVESTFLATQVLKSHDSPKLRRRVGQDKTLLPRLIELVDGHPQNADHQALAAKLRDLEKVYAPVVVSINYKPATTDSARKVTRIGSKSKVRYKKEDLANITSKIADLRKEFVQ
jgi:hypothetical protein